MFFYCFTEFSNPSLLGKDFTANFYRIGEIEEMKRDFISTKMGFNGNFPCYFIELVFGFGVGTLAHENPFIELLILVFTSSNLIYVEP